METIALKLQEMTWAEMDEFAGIIVLISTDENGFRADERHVSQCLIDWADNKLTE